MIVLLQRLLTNYRQVKNAVANITGNELRLMAVALIEDYGVDDAKTLAAANAYTYSLVVANINAVLPQTDSNAGGTWGTLTVTLATGVIVNSKGSYIAGKQRITKNGQLLVPGVDYVESSPNTGTTTLDVIPLFSNDIITVEYYFLQTPISPLP